MGQCGVVNWLAIEEVVVEVVKVGCGGGGCESCMI